LEKIIVFNPDKRLSIYEAIEHNYINSIRESNAEDPVFTGKLDLEFDK